MRAFFPFEHIGDMNPLYCVLYEDMYTWRLGKMYYAGRDTIKVLVTADSIKRSCYESAMSKILRDSIHLNSLFGHLDLHGIQYPIVNLNSDEFSGYQVVDGFISDVKTYPEDLPYNLIESCEHILQFTFVNHNISVVDKIEYKGIEL